MFLSHLVCHSEEEYEKMKTVKYLGSHATTRNGIRSFWLGRYTIQLCIHAMFNLINKLKKTSYLR